MRARYADLAESYAADAVYASGTVLVFGGAQEVTISTKINDPTVAGVVTTNPAYLMNAMQPGEFVVDIALIGRIPVNVVGNIKKGDLLITSSVAGVATSKNDSDSPLLGTIIGKALENFNSDLVGVIEVAVGKS